MSWSETYRKIPLCKVKTDARQSVDKAVEQTDLREPWAVGGRVLQNLRELQPVPQIRSAHPSSTSQSKEPSC